jgi:RNA polymerase sigma-70 factor (ECF subfamily)
MAAAVQPNVILWGGDGPLLQPQFPGMAAGYSRVRAFLMIDAELQLRSADDLRRAAQMAAAQAGDRVAYEALLRDCVPLIRAVAMRRGVAADYVEDVVQDVLLTIHRARQTYDPSRSFSAWLRTIAERRAIDLLRRIGRQQAREVHSPLDFETFADETARPADNGPSSGSRVNDALASLPERQREAVQVLVLEERSLSEAAVATHRSKGALKVNLHRALKALRGKFGETTERS